jgi:hypothetical protein
MKVGILTYHHVTNYGSWLQAYALKTVLQQLGHSVEFVDYRPYKSVFYYLQALYPFRQGKRRPYFNPDWIANIIKAWKFRQLLRNKMTLGKPKCYTQTGLRQYAQRYDVLICGSDQIWDIHSPIRRYDSAYFLDFAANQTTRKISYAASCGSTTELGTYRTEVTQLLNQFETILVRDRNTLNLLQQDCQLTATKVLDPTLLMADYSELVRLPQTKQKYLLVYYQGRMPLAQVALTQAIARARGLSIISVGYHHPVAQQNLIGIGIEEWLGYFSQASYVLTDTFHGTIFSILFRRPFSVFVNAAKSLKVIDLLNDVGLENRAIVDASTVSPADPACAELDYSKVAPQLETKINSSIRSLELALQPKLQLAEKLS